MELFELEDRTLGRVLAAQAARHGDKPMLRMATGDEISYRELHERSSNIAEGLQQLGLRQGDPILLLLDDSIDFFLTVCAIAKLGAVQVPVNRAYRGEFLSRLINDCTATKIIVDADYIDRLDQVASHLHTLEQCIVHGSNTMPRRLPAALSKRCAALAFADLCAATHGAGWVEPAYHDLMAIMYTSGTTGASKGVMTSHAHAYRYAANCAEGHEIGSDDRFYTSGLPLFHIAGQWGVVYGSMIRGATAVCRPGYRNEYFWPDIVEHDCTAVFLLGAIANFLWQQPPTPSDADNSLAKVEMYPVMPEYEEFAQRFGVQISSGYGLTECPGPLSHKMGESFPTPRCVGRTRPGFEVKILDPFDEECDDGVTGEICIRPQNPSEIMLGYWHKPDATARAFRNLWFHTGDSGQRDAQGRFYFVDRLGDSIRRRGENISTMEVESVINQHPAVFEAAVFPVWAESEQEVMTAIVLHETETFVVEEFIEFLNERMPYFMVPRYVEVVETLPKTPTGKMRKFTLRESGLTPNTWDRVVAGIKLRR